MPQIVKAAAHDDGGQAFVSKLFTLGTVVLLVTAGAATVAAPWLVAAVRAISSRPSQHALATAFAYWCLPQIFFYGALRAGRRDPQRAPDLRPLHLGADRQQHRLDRRLPALHLAVRARRSRSTDWTPEMIALLAGTATLGIVVQAVVLLLFWRRAGPASAPGLPLARRRTRQIGRLAGWTFLMVVAGQLAGLVQSRVLSGASGEAAASSSSQNAWLHLHAPLLDHRAVDRDALLHPAERARRMRDAHDDVRGDIGRSIRTLGLFVVIATAALIVAAVPASRIFTGSAAQATAAAQVLRLLPRGPRAARRAVRDPAHLLRLRRHPHTVLLHTRAVRPRRRERRWSPRRPSPWSFSRRASRSASPSRASCR